MKETLFKLVAIHEHSGQTYFACRLIDPSAKRPEIKYLKSKTKEFRWQVLGFSFLPWRADKKGFREMAVKPLMPDAHASVGEILIGETDFARGGRTQHS